MSQGVKVSFFPHRGHGVQVGYVSPDFYTHSVSYFAEAPLVWHGRIGVTAPQGGESMTAPGMRRLMCIRHRSWLPRAHQAARQTSADLHTGHLFTCCRSTADLAEGLRVAWHVLKPARPCNPCSVSAPVLVAAAVTGCAVSSLRPCHPLGRHDSSGRLLRTPGRLGRLQLALPNGQPAGPAAAAAEAQPGARARARGERKDFDG